MNGLSEIGPPSKADGENVVLGLTQAVEELCKMSELQQKKIAEEGDGTVENKGRIICMTHGRRYIGCFPL